MVWIAIDAMGGDHAPEAIVKGAVLGARLYKVGIRLVGDPAQINPILRDLDTQGLYIDVVEAKDVIQMDESPATALRKKKDASIVVTAKQVSSGKAQGMVAAGSTGAAMGAALLYIGRIHGVDRPAIGVTLPTLNTPCLLIDGGANADCIPEMLLQFARMGSVFMHNVYQQEKPRVGLLNIGEEAGKGNAFVNSAFKLLENDHSIHFIGNIEGRDLFAGTVDVAVCDGFTGNIAIKSAEGVVKMFGSFLKQELKRNITTQAGALLAKGAFDRAKQHVDHEIFGGALLLGVKGICVIAHGGSSAVAIENAIRVAKNAIDTEVLSKISGQMADSVSHHSGSSSTGTSPTDTSTSPPTHPQYQT
ncbi:MAG: phosphate acyltransferase PlsX [Cyanobacteria bacterium]|nr:phosphate acyltransferase PlsX [Cyanobacteriota bacterium]